VARSQSRRNTEALFDFTHVGFDVVVDLEAIRFQVSDPFFAATAIGIAVHIDRDQFGGLGQRGDEQGRKDCQTQCGFHRLSLADYFMQRHFDHFLQ
jgi:hypothetical protein